MHINEAYTTEKVSKASTSSSSTSTTSKNSGPQDHHLPSTSAAVNSGDISLIKYKGQKWQDVFDFDKMLKHMRVVEKNHKGQSVTLRTATQPKQVQRLDAADMHYYGIVPKQTPLDFVICNVCRGIYTKVGFKNHMRAQHPTVWSTVPNKVALPVDVVVSDSSQDGIRDVASPAEQQASTSHGSTAALSALHPTTASASSATTHRRTVKSIAAGGGRARNKSKNIIISTGVQSSAIVEVAKKKSAASAALALSAAVKEEIVTASSTGSSGSTPETVPHPLNVYSSSSNSSCSMPATPQALVVSVAETGREKTFSPLHDTKDKLVVDSTAAPSVVTFKKKVKNPAFIAKERVESSASSSTSASGEYERGKSSFRSTVGKVATGKITVIAAKNLTRYDIQKSELDQAVSSITSAEHDDNDALLEDSEDAISRRYKIQPKLSARTKKIKTERVYAPQHSSRKVKPPHASNENSMQAHEEIIDTKFISEIIHTAPDSQYRYEEPRETHVRPRRSHQHYSQQQPLLKRMRYEEVAELVHTQPSTQPKQQLKLEQTNEYVSFQQQQHQLLLEQQQQQQQQHYAQYDESFQEDIKVFKTEPTSIDDPYQSQLTLQQQPHQITTIDAMQLHQLLCQQQNLNPYSETVEHPQQQEAYGQPTIDLCDEEVLQKPRHLGEYAALAVAGNNDYVEEHSYETTVLDQFQLYSVPSLTDDDDVLMSPMVSSVRAAQQYVLPAPNEEQIIYEITSNNQVAVMSQQRQQQVITEFLTQAGYQNVENVHAAAAGLQASDTNEFGELPEFDATPPIDTVKSLAFSGSAMPDLRSIIKSEHGAPLTTVINPAKFHEDFYFNTFSYSSIPRPMAMNGFGLVKLPLALATTFRKTLLCARKANNSPVALCGSIVGGMSSIPSAVASRCIASLSTRPSGNYFTALTGSSGAVGGEYSIGSITITNTPTAVQFGHHRQLGAPSAPIEISFNAPGSGSGAAPSAPISTLHRFRTKPNPGLGAYWGGASTVVGGYARSKSLIGISSPAMRHNAGLVQSGRTVFMGAAHIHSAVSERVKFVRRTLITKVGDEESRNCNFTASQVAEMFGVGNQGTGQRQEASDEDQPPFRPYIAERFYERRRRMLHHLELNSSAARQQQQKLRQQLLRQKLLRMPSASVRAY